MTSTAAPAATSIVCKFHREFLRAGAYVIVGSRRGSIVSGTTARGLAPGINASSSGANDDGAGGTVARTATFVGTVTVAAGRAVPQRRHSVHPPGTMYPQPGHLFIEVESAISAPDWSDPK